MKTEQRNMKLSKENGKTNFRVNTTTIKFYRRGKNLERTNDSKEEKWSSYKERKGNALAPGADEGRSNLR